MRARPAGGGKAPGLKTPRGPNRLERGGLPRKIRSGEGEPAGCRDGTERPWAISVRAQGRRATPLKVIVRIVVTSKVTTDAGNGAYVSDAAAVCATLSTAHRRKSTSAFAFAWVIPLG